jgi:excisionase family DNA binding protein
MEQNELLKEHLRMVKALRLVHKDRLRTNEVTALFGLSRSVIERLIKQNVIKPYMTKTGTWWLFDKNQFWKLIQTDKVPSGEKRLLIAIKQCKLLLIRKTPYIRTYSRD